MTRLGETLRAYQARDPAARSRLEIFLLYPGVHAVIYHRLAAPGLELPPDIEQPLLAQLWERGMVRGEDLVVTERKGEP